MIEMDAPSPESDFQLDKANTYQQPKGIQYICYKILESFVTSKNQMADMTEGLVSE